MAEKADEPEEETPLLFGPLPLEMPDLIGVEEDGTKHPFWGPSIPELLPHEKVEDAK
jgi:hypothetical protein